MRRGVRSAHPRSRGQVLPIFAIVIILLFAVTALVIDTGFLFGQRRYDQNGADAAALAAGRLLASSVAPRDENGNTYFFVTEQNLFDTVHHYAGLDASQLNQNTNMAPRNDLAVTVEYSGLWNAAPSQWCYSTLGDVPNRVGTTPCAANIITGPNGPMRIPPYPSASVPFRVRVTVSSVTDPFLALPVFGFGDVAPSPAPANAEDVAACSTPPGATGNTTCAHAVVAVKGSATFKGKGPLIPVTTASCDIAPDSVGQLFEMWGAAQSPACAPSVNPWQNILDFTTEQKWCSDPTFTNNADPDYRYFRRLPTTVLPANLARTTGSNACLNTDATWDRDTFVPDTSWSGQNDDPKSDLPYWIAVGFGGSIHASFTDGNKVPTYIDVRGGASGGNQGQNIAAGFYCGASGVTPTSCPTGINASGTYFFATNQDGFEATCPDEFGETYGYGCRDVTVPAWANPEWVTGLASGGTGWNTTGGGGGPNRVRIVRLLNMRVYCKWEGSTCTKSPTNTNSDVWGLFLSPFEENQCTDCTSGPSINGNVAVLER